MQSLSGLPNLNIYSNLNYDWELDQLTAPSPKYLRSVMIGSVDVSTTGQKCANLDLAGTYQSSYMYMNPSQRQNGFLVEVQGGSASIDFQAPSIPFIEYVSCMLVDLISILLI